MTATTIHTLGEGKLSWPRRERVSDRYGTVLLESAKLSRDAEGQHGSLIAEVLATRESGHIGDFFRGLAPSTPEVGERVVLGTGTAFFDHDFGEDLVGLSPDDGRDFDWLAPEALYRVHDQTVRLVLEVH